MNSEYRGIFAANTTPFNQDGSLNHDALSKEINYLIASGVNGFFAGGTYGEGPMMNTDEFSDYVTTFSSVVAHRVPIIAQVGAPTYEQTMAQAQSASKAGVNAIAAIPPFYYPHDDNALLQFYENLARDSAMPVFIYNNPWRSGNKVSPALFGKLCRIPGVVGMKDSSDSLTEFCRYSLAANEGFHLMLGNDDMTFAGFVMGAPGAIVVLAGLFPELYVKMYQAFQKGDLAEGRRLQYEAIKVRMVLKRGPYVSTYKAVLNLLGRNGGYSKKPIRMPSQEEMDQIQHGLRDLGYLK